MASGWTTLLDFDLFRRSCFNLKTDLGLHVLVGGSGWEMAGG